MKKYIRDGRAPIPRNEAVSRTMSAIRAKNTGPEVILRKALWKGGMIGYRLHKNHVPGRPDIVFSRVKLAVFVNGCYWHRCSYCKPSMPKTHKKFWREKFEKNIRRDRIKREELRSQGWTVRTVWECQIKKDLRRQIKKIAKDHKILNKT